MPMCADPHDGYHSGRPTDPTVPNRSAVTDLSFGTGTDPGLHREANEDRVAALHIATSDPNTPATVIVVADGMGAESGGARAAQTMIDSFSRRLSEQLASVTASVPAQQLAALLEDAVDASNTAVRLAQRHARVTHRHMATTAVCMLIVGEQAAYANVGDSRIYLMRRDELIQLSVDHSLIWDVQERAGTDSSQFRRSITRGIGFADQVTPDIGLLKLKPGDRLLLCSDGLSNYVHEPDIRRLLHDSATPEDSSYALLQAALRGGGGDNVTVAVCHFGTTVIDYQDEYEPEDLVDPPDPEPTVRRVKFTSAIQKVTLVLLACILLGALAYRQFLVSGHPVQSAPGRPSSQPQRAKQRPAKTATTGGSG